MKPGIGRTIYYIDKDNIIETTVAFIGLNSFKTFECSNGIYTGKELWYNDYNETWFVSKNIATKRLKIKMRRISAIRKNIKATSIGYGKPAKGSRINNDKCLEICLSCDRPKCDKGYCDKIKGEKHD